MRGRQSKSSNPQTATTPHLDILLAAPPLPLLVEPVRNPPDRLYIELLKNALCGAIYPETSAPVSLYWAKRGWMKKMFAPILTRTFGAFGAELRFFVKHSEEDIATGRIWPVHAHTMVGVRRMENLVQCLEAALGEGIPGHFIETGVWRGGACILARGVFAAHGVEDRRVYVADSFRGLPKPNAGLYPADAGDIHHEFDFLSVSRVQVEDHFRRYGLLDAQVVFLEGWFKDTLPTIGDEKFAVIRLDGDMYESTMDAFRSLYSKLSPGGFCIIDDYMIASCRKAVEDFRTANGINEPIKDIDGWAVYWRKAH
jgi:O-methyltransferase